MTRGDEDEATGLLSRVVMNKAARVSCQHWADPAADKVLPLWG